MLGELDRTATEAAGRFLGAQRLAQVSVVDFLSLLYGAHLVEAASGTHPFTPLRDDWRGSSAKLFEQFRRDDGGYAKTPASPASSTYQTFLVLLAGQLIGKTVPDADRLVRFVLSRRRDDGGFVEVAPMQRSGTNPTAAAMGTLLIVDRLDTATRDSAARFLAGMQTDEGGLRANSRIAIADVLSTFTGLLTLCDLDHARTIDIAAARRYVESLQHPDGGFRGAAWDDQADVEYTFYGLGTLALVNLLDQ